MKYEGLKKLLYFAYGSLLKGVCSETGNKSFSEKVRLYLEGDSSLEKEIIEEIYEELPHAILNLREMSRENTFSRKNVDEYIFKKHNREVMPGCMVISGTVKGIDRKNKKLDVLSNGKIYQVEYLPSIEKTFKRDIEVFFHHGWLIKK